MLQCKFIHFNQTNITLLRISNKYINNSKDKMFLRLLLSKLDRLNKGGKLNNIAIVLNA